MFFPEFFLQLNGSMLVIGHMWLEAISNKNLFADGQKRIYEYDLYLILSFQLHKQEYKSHYLIEVNTYDVLSTKTRCGSIGEATLANRVYVCENVSYNEYLKTKDRDVNAAMNIHVGINRCTRIKIQYSKACGDTTSDCQTHGWYLAASAK